MPLFGIVSATRLFVARPPGGCIAWDDDTVHPLGAQGEESMPYQSIRVVHPDQFDSATAQTPGSKRTAAIHPGAGKFTDVGRPLPRRAWSPYGNTSRRRATHDRLCPQRLFFRFAGAKGRMERHLASQRLSLCSGVPPTPGT